MIKASADRDTSLESVSLVCVITPRGGHVTGEHLKKPSRQLMQLLADNILTYRKSNHISQEKLTGMCDLHRTDVCSVERGERNAQDIGDFGCCIWCQCLRTPDQGSL
ncbi:MAG: hypothetical protein M2R45_00529 [Verrucomicrobia subdivision 3 bacterium]|nr:hypothetical protein [Limisphaerales bacterium]MCS1413593.1 hypothetical protein [Limisphaerales bacterium]